MTDRTGEFQGAVKVFRATILSSTTTANGAPLPGPPSSLDDAFGPPPPPPRPEKSEFFQLASSVAVGFEGTAKLVSNNTSLGLALYFSTQILRCQSRALQFTGLIVYW